MASSKKGNPRIGSRTECRGTVALFVAHAVALWSLSVSAFAENGYVIIDAVASPASAKQPTWIGLSARRGRSKHVPVGAGIVEMTPGTYGIDHIDYTKSPRGRDGTITRRGPIGYEFVVESSAITLVGVVRITQSNDARKSKYNLRADVHSMPLLERACQAKPEVLEKLLVNYQLADGSYKRIKVKCSI